MLSFLILNIVLPPLVVCVLVFGHGSLRIMAYAICMVIVQVYLCDFPDLVLIAQVYLCDFPDLVLTVQVNLLVIVYLHSWMLVFCYWLFLSWVVPLF